MEANSTDSTNADQIAYWNGPQGQRWLAHQQSQDAAEPAADDEWLRRRRLDQTAAAETEATDAGDL